MEQLVSDSADIGFIQAQGLGEPFQAYLLARGGVPVFNELSKRLIDLAFDRNYPDLLA